MFRINPINYGSNNYHLVRNNRKVHPIDKINNSGDSNSNSFGFEKNLEEEIQKQKSKGKKNG